MFMLKKTHEKEVNELIRINLFTSQSAERLQKEHWRTVRELAKANEKIAEFEKQQYRDGLLQKILYKGERSKLEYQPGDI